jgi:hypothetical protein
MPIVTYAHRYKRPPLKRKAVALEVPAVVKAGKPRQVADPAPDPTQPVRPAIVTAIKPRATRFGNAPDLSAEEHQRCGDAANVLFRELVRRTAHVRTAVLTV